MWEMNDREDSHAKSSFGSVCFLEITRRITLTLNKMWEKEKEGQVWWVDGGEDDNHIGLNAGLEMIREIWVRIQIMKLLKDFLLLRKEKFERVSLLRMKMKYNDMKWKCGREVQGGTAGEDGDGPPLRWQSYPGKEEAEIAWSRGERGRRDVGADKFKS